MVTRKRSTLKRRLLNGFFEGGGAMIPVDRISSLPESIIAHILSLLPTESAVATSFLSKSWRFRWTNVTAFDFSDDLWPNHERSQPETRGAAVPAMNFVEFVNLVFMSHSESIYKLRLRWQSRNVRSVYLKMWLNTAIARNVRVLDLATVPRSSIDTSEHISDEIFEFDMPAGIYTCATLEVLKLRGPFRVKLPHVVSLPQLTVLELVCVKYEVGFSVERLISTSPLLETLKIKMNHHFTDVLDWKVCSASLKCLEIYHYEGCGCGSDNMELVIDTPVLEHLVISGDRFREITCVQVVMPVNELGMGSVCESNLLRGDGAAGIIQACDGVKVMTLRETAMLALGRGTAQFPPTFGRLTTLVVEFTLSHWRFLLDLIDRCPRLEVLHIIAYAIDAIDEAERFLESPGSYWKHPARVPVCLSSSLKHVKFVLNDGIEDEMIMIKYLLDHGVLIERVALCCGYGYRLNDTQKLKLLNEVSMLSRASTACKISFS